MSKLRNLIVDPNDPTSLAETLSELVRIVNGEMDFGDPLDPNSDQSTVLAGGTGVGAHNGRPSNLRCTWVELEFEALDTVVTARHNLGVPVTNSEVNVRWQIMGIRHSGVGATGASALSVNYEDGDVITADTIQLRAYSSSGRTVDAGNPVRVSLLFSPATRWPN